mmetsp:Transcript_87646/g.253125  ORF Transcript_87646/g.253125 Transcript_87646/m.253125 type:complete len:307 (+) Transcript_87646:245-1165(+)
MSGPITSSTSLGALSPSLASPGKVGSSGSSLIRHLASRIAFRSPAKYRCSRHCAMPSRCPTSFTSMCSRSPRMSSLMLPIASCSSCGIILSVPKDRDCWPATDARKDVAFFPSFSFHCWYQENFRSYAGISATVSKAIIPALHTVMLRVSATRPPSRCAFKMASASSGGAYSVAYTTSWQRTWESVFTRPSKSKSFQRARPFAPLHRKSVDGLMSKSRYPSVCKPHAIVTRAQWIARSSCKDIVVCEFAHSDIRCFSEISPSSMAMNCSPVSGSGAGFQSLSWEYVMISAKQDLKFICERKECALP